MNKLSFHKKIIHCVSCDSELLAKFGETNLSYKKFRCEDCGEMFNERTETPFNRLEYPTDVTTVGGTLVSFL